MRAYPTGIASSLNRHLDVDMGRTAVRYVRKEDIKTVEDIVRYLSDYSDFETAVYVATFKIPKGKVCTYHGIARMIGKPKATRAVANALHNNPLYPIVPCWRVVKSDGGFGGDPKAAAGRRKHVEEEGVPIRNGKVAMGEEVLF
jgi:methylated-DNA-[protein]-cysteine S-methyltransferase